VRIKCSYHSCDSTGREKIIIPPLVCGRPRRPLKKRCWFTFSSMSYRPAVVYQSNRLEYCNTLRHWIILSLVSRAGGESVLSHLQWKMEMYPWIRSVGPAYVYRNCTFQWKKIRNSCASTGSKCKSADISLVSPIRHYIDLLCICTSCTTNWSNGVWAFSVLRTHNTEVCCLRGNSLSPITEHALVEVKTYLLDNEHHKSHSINSITMLH